MDHFDEVAGAVRTAVKVTLFRCPPNLLPPRCSWHVSGAGRKAREYRIDVLHSGIFAANHHAIAALQSPDTAAGAYIDIVNLSGRKLLGSTNVVNVIGVATVDQYVIRFEKRREAGDHFVHYRGRHHQPESPRFPQL